MHDAKKDVCHGGVKRLQVMAMIALALVENLLVTGYTRWWECVTMIQQ